MIKHTVKSLVNSYVTRDPFELCDCLDIAILRNDLGCEINGFFQKTNTGFKIIHLNSNLTNEEEKYVCAHELGHALLHNNISLQLFFNNKLQIRGKFEIEADKFAAELLVDDTLDATEYHGLNIEQISSKLCVPAKLVRYKFGMKT